MMMLTTGITTTTWMFTMLSYTTMTSRDMTSLLSVMMQSSWLQDKSRQIRDIQKNLGDNIVIDIIKTAGRKLMDYKE